MCLQAHAMDLAYDTSGTHILRAMVSVLGGQAPSVHKSKAVNAAREKALAGAAHAAAPAETTQAACTGSYYPLLPSIEAQTLKRALVSIVHALGDCDVPCEAPAAAGQELPIPADVIPLESRESALYALCSDGNAGPLLQHCVQVCASAAPRTAAYLCRRMLNWGLQVRILSNYGKV